MSFELNVKELILKDVISKHKTGLSTLKVWKNKSSTYYTFKNISNYSYILSLATFMLFLTKKTSGRQSVYLIAPIALLATGFLSGKLSNYYFESYKNETGVTDDKKLKEFLYFHKYALI